MVNTTKLSAEQKTARQLIASHHIIQPSDYSSLIHSECDSCHSHNISWVTTEAYLSLSGDATTAKHVLDHPDGEAWICLECEGIGYLASSTDADDSFIEETVREVREQNAGLISRIPESVLSDEEKSALNNLLTSVHTSGLHSDYELFFDLSKGFSEKEYALAGGAIAMELHDNSDDVTLQHNMVALALLAAPLVSVFAPDVNPTTQMPVIVKGVGKVLTEKWRSDDFSLTDTHRLNYARGLVLRMLCTPKVVIGNGYHEDVYTQWIGANYKTLMQNSEAVRQNAQFEFDAMAKWVGKEEAIRFIMESEKTGVASLTSSVELGYVVESLELEKDIPVGKINEHSRSIDDTGRYVFKLAQLGFLNEYASLHGYSGRRSEMPAYKLVEALGMRGAGAGGDGLAEEIILALTAVDQNLLDDYVDSVRMLDQLSRIRIINALDEMVNSIELNEVGENEIALALSNLTGYRDELKAV